MRFSVDLCVLVLMMGLCVLVSDAGSATRVETGVNSPGLGHEEAVVTRIESDRVVLRSTSAGSREFFVSREKHGDLRAGDKVMVEGDTVKKLGDVSKQDGVIPSPAQGAAIEGSAGGATGAPDNAPAKESPAAGP